MTSFKFNNLLSSKRKNNRMNRRVQLALETLEDRAVPAGISVTAFDDVLRIDGTDAYDHVEVTATKSVLTVKENNQTVATFKKPTFTRVEFHGKAGDDTFTNNTALITEAYGDEGNDYLTGGSAADLLFGGSPAVDNAVQLDETYHFRAAADYSYNWGGKQEKWVRGHKDAWFYILPSGDVYEWAGGKTATGTLVGTVDERYYEQPQKLILAEESGRAYSDFNTDPSVEESTIATDTELGLDSTGNYYFNWAGKNEMWLEGREGEWYYILPTGALHLWTPETGENPLVDELDPVFHEQPELLHDAADNQLAREYGFYSTGDYYQNYGGLQEKWLKGNGEQWFYIVPDGGVYRWNSGATTNADLIGTLGRSFYSQPSKLQEAAHSVLIGLGDRSYAPNQDAAELDEQLQLRSTGNYWFDFDGQKEKWLKGKDDGWYKVLPNGDVYRDNGAATKVGRVDSKYYDDIYKLHNAGDLELLRSHGLYRGTNDWLNAIGLQEKWLKGNGNDWYYIVPDGGIYHWNRGEADDDLLGMVDTSYYQDPAKIHAATDMSDIDILVGGSGNDALIGGVGDDQMTANQGDDVLNVGSGHNWVTGNQGFDRIELPAEGDVILTQADSRIDGKIVNFFSEIEAATVTGSDGNDTIDASRFQGPLRLWGNAGDDRLIGGSGDDVLYGGAGNDTLFGRAGDDKLYGHAGNDLLHGEDGDDHLVGKTGNDTLYGGNGDDYLEGGRQTDTLIDSVGYNVYLPNEGRFDGERDIIKISRDDDKRDVIFASREDSLQVSGNPRVQYAEDLAEHVKAFQIGRFVEAVFIGGVGGSEGLVYDWSGTTTQVYRYVSTYAAFGVQLDVSAGIVFAQYYGGFDIVQGRSYSVEAAFAIVGGGAIYDQPSLTAKQIGWVESVGPSLGALPGSATFVITDTTLLST